MIKIRMREEAVKEWAKDTIKYSDPEKYADPNFQVEFSPEGMDELEKASIAILLRLIQEAAWDARMKAYVKGEEGNLRVTEENVRGGYLAVVRGMNRDGEYIQMEGYR